MEGSPNCQLLCRHFDPTVPTLVPTCRADKSALSACVEFVIVRPIGRSIRYIFKNRCVAVSRNNTNTYDHERCDSRIT